MTEQEAKKYILPFGRYAFESLDDIIRYHDDVLYLDKLLGWKDIDPLTKEALTLFLKLPHIKIMLEEKMREGSEYKKYSEPEINTLEPRKWWEK